MAEREEISGSAGTVGHEGGGRKWVRDNIDPLRQAEAIDWWQEQRWAAREFCQRRFSELRELARTRYWTDCLNGATPTELFPLAVQTSLGALQKEKGGVNA